MLEWTGERYLPFVDPGICGAEIHYEHLHRYAFAAQFVKGKKVLDLACGEGYGSFMLSNEAESVVGIELDEGTVKHAIGKYFRANLEFIQGSILDIPLEKEKIFDVIVLFEGLEHVDAHQQVLSEVNRLLREDGIFIVSTPNRETYSEIPHFNNIFHRKELYFDEFKKLLADYFKHICFYGQRVFPISHMWSLYSQKPSHFSEFVIQKGGNEFNFSEGVNKAPLYYIAVASNRVLDGHYDMNSYLIDASTALFEEYKRQIHEQTAPLQARINSLESERAAFLAEMDAMREQMQERDAELAAMREQMQKRDAELAAMHEQINSHQRLLFEANRELEATRQALRQAVRERGAARSELYKAGAGRSPAALQERLTRALEEVGCQAAEARDPSLLKAITNLLPPERLPHVLESIEKGIVVKSPIPLGVPCKPSSMPLERSLRLLFVCWETPMLYHGGGVAMLNLMRELARRHEVSVITYCENERDVEPLRKHVKLVKCFSRNAEVDPKACPHPLAPLVYTSHFSPGMQAAIEAELCKESYDLVQLEYLGSAMYHTPGVRRTLVDHEVSYQGWSHLANNAQPGSHLRYQYWANALDVFSFEIGALADYADSLIMVTEEDAMRLLSYNPSLSLFVHPRGVDTEFYAISPGKLPEHMVYVGYYAHYPNVESAVKIAEEIMPLIRRQAPRAEVSLVGRGIWPALRGRLSRCPGVSVVGAVEDLRPFINESVIYLAPIFSGMGIRLKILEALSAGKAVITTPLGMQGIDLIPGEEWAPAETVQEFAEAAVRLMRNPDEARDMGLRAARTIRQKYSWPARAQHLEAIFAAVLNTNAIHEPEESPSLTP